MTARPARAAALAVAAAALAACGPGDESLIPSKVRVQDLELPSEAEREARAKLHEAEVLLAADKPRLAEPLLRRVVELDPSDAHAAELLARCLVARGRADEAEPLVRRSLAEAPGNEPLHGLHVQILTSLGDAEGAAAAADAWTVAQPASADAWFELGRALYRVNRLDDAISAFRRAEAFKGARADIRSELGLALAAAGQLAKAEAKQRDALDRQPDYAEAWFRLGDVIFRRDRGRAREAVEAMSRAVELEPSNTVAQLYLWRTCRLADAPDDDPMRARGEDAWRAVLRIHGRAQLAAALGSAGQPDDATSEFALREKVSLAPDDPAPRLALARHMVAERRFPEAVEAFRKAVECGAGDAATRLHLAVALLGRGDAAAAETELAAAEALAPGDPHVLRLKAWVLLLGGREAEAAAAADAALAGIPGEVHASKIRALARMRLGEVDAGLQDLAALGWL